MYRQCRLQRGSQFDQAWIPEKFAQVGRVIRVKRDGEWSDGWAVVMIFGQLSDGAAESGRDEYRYHREVTDR